MSECRQKDMDNLRSELPSDCLQKCFTFLRGGMQNAY